MNANIESLKKIIKKSRIHFYKPIQIAEILYRYRIGELNSLKDHDKIRRESKKWRDTITLKFINSKSTSSAKYQDDLFSNDAVPFAVLEKLGEYNNAHDGVLEAYIYECFTSRHNQLKNALQLTKDDEFNIKHFVESFTQESGLKRSTDKIYEIIIFALFESLVEIYQVHHKVYLKNNDAELLSEFDGFADLVLGLTEKLNYESDSPAHFFRAGVTNAADRGIDLYANSGHVVQVKHVDLDSDVLSGIGSSVSSNKIIIICKSFHEKTIKRVLKQLGFGDRIQSIITFEQVYEWYANAFKGKFSAQLKPRILAIIKEQITLEFPILDSKDFNKFLRKRGYLKLNTKMVEKT